MALIYSLKNPQKKADNPTRTITFTVFERVIVSTIGDESLSQKFPSTKRASEHLQRIISLRQREGYVLMETREIEAELPDTESPPELAMTFDAAKNRMVMTFNGDSSGWDGKNPNLIKPFPAKSLKSISARLQKASPRCVQVLCDPGSPGSQLAKMLPPSLEALIFDTCRQTVSRLARVYVEVPSLIDFLSGMGVAPLTWTLCATDSGYDDMDAVLKLLDKREALRSRKLSLDLGGLPFDYEIEQLQKRGVTTEDARKRFGPEAYQDW